jgi:hypothetical protein
VVVVPGVDGPALLRLRRSGSRGCSCGLSTMIWQICRVVSVLITGWYFSKIENSYRSRE